MSVTSFCAIPRGLCLGVAVVVAAGCAGGHARRGEESLASRCYYAAAVAAEVNPMLDESLGLCDRALTTISLSRRNQAATLSNRGILRLHQAAFERAKQDFDQAIQLIPDAGEPYVNRAAALLRLGRYGEAVDDLNRAISLNSSFLEKAFYNRAVAREHLNDIKGAYYDYLKASQLRPDWNLPKQDLQRFKIVTRSRLA